MLESERNCSGRGVTAVRSYRDIPNAATEMAVRMRATSRSRATTEPLSHDNSSSGRTRNASPRPGTEETTESTSQAVALQLSGPSEADPPLISAFRMVGNILDAVDSNYLRPPNEQMPAAEGRVRGRPVVRTLWEILDDATSVTTTTIWPQEAAPGTSTGSERRNEHALELIRPRNRSSSEAQNPARPRTPRNMPLTRNVLGGNALMNDLFTANRIGVFNIAINNTGRHIRWSSRSDGPMNGIIQRYRGRNVSRVESRADNRPEPLLSSFKLNDSEGKSAWDAAAEKECQICLCNFNLNEEVCFLPCAHLFHFDCIRQWLKRQSTCPVCRTNSEE